MALLVDKIVSGGQTGADRGGLDAAIELGIPHGGWCPKGRRAEDGKVPQRYKLQETGSSSYQSRTRRNVVDSDGTVIFTRGRLEGGSLLTARVAQEIGKPCLHLDLRQAGVSTAETVQRQRAWLVENEIRVLNVAGSRESKAPGLGRAVAKLTTIALATTTYEPEIELVTDRLHFDAADESAQFGNQDKGQRNR